MYRGSTPTLMFTLQIDPEKLEALYITIAQDKTVVLEKNKDDCNFDGFTVTCDLTQEDTLALKDGKNTEVQVRVRTKDGKSYPSRIIPIAVDRILKEGVI